MESFIFGYTKNQLPILGYRFGQIDRGIPLLILGGVHGDEIEGVIAAQGLLNALMPEEFLHLLDLTVVPALNYDGFLAQTRSNASKVDLNRNLPTTDWQPKALKPKYYPGLKPNSEPENQSLVAHIQLTNPKYIISLHSWKPLLNVNGNIKDLAKRISRHTSYEIVEDIGYATPGSLGTYGTENNIPVLTYEIERNLSTEKILQIHVPAIVNALKEEFLS